LTFEFIRTVPCTVVLRWVSFQPMGGTVVGHEGSAHFQNWRSHDGIGLIFRRYVPGILHHQKVRARGGEQTIYEQARVYFHHNAPALTIPISLSSYSFSCSAQRFYETFKVKRIWTMTKLRTDVLWRLAPRRLPTNSGIYSLHLPLHKYHSS